MIIKRYEITDSVDGRSLGYLPKVSGRRLARKSAQRHADELGFEISLHEIGRFGARTLLDHYRPEKIESLS